MVLSMREHCCIWLRLQSRGDARVSGVAEGSHLAKSFKTIQAAHGDEVAFKYLAANSDAFVT